MIISKPVPQLTKEQWAYFAGIVDGEGCLTLSRAINKQRKHKPVLIYYRPVLTIETTSKPLQDWLINVFGKGYCARNPHKGNHKDRYLWLLSKKADIFDVCLGIRPYVVIKKNQVEVMLDFLKVDMSHNQEHGYAQKHLVLYDDYKNMFRKLNFRGRIENSANSENAKVKAMPTPSQAPVMDACVETNVQEPKGVI